MFEGFTQRQVKIGAYEISLVMGGSGPPLLLLHGYPQSRAIWHAVAPSLARHFTLVIPDLPGYGDSLGPAPDAENRHYSKRAMAEVLRKLMAELGWPSFFLAGHDRGGRVAYRLALDSPASVARLAVLDVVPTLAVWEEMDWRSALATYHWPFLAQPAELTERLIGADPDFYLEHLLARWAGDRGRLDPRAVSDYRRHFRKASVIAATCADYRAGATLDVDHDRADRAAGRRIDCPVLVLWGRDYHATKAGSPLEIWRDWATDARDVPLDCGHFLVEEKPEESAEALAAFFCA